VLFCHSERSEESLIVWSKRARIKPEMFRFAQHDNYLNPIHKIAASNFQNQSLTINNQQTKRDVRGVLKL